jgi:hypothetical protein
LPQDLGDREHRSRRGRRGRFGSGSEDENDCDEDQEWKIAEVSAHIKIVSCFGLKSTTRTAIKISACCLKTFDTLRDGLGGRG